MRKTRAAAVLVLCAAVAAYGCRDGGAPTALAADAAPAAAPSLAAAQVDDDDRNEFTDSYPLASCTWTNNGRNPYFVLTPGHVLELRGRDDGEAVVLKITVLNETKVVTGVTTRVVEERETKDGALYEVSRNYFAICAQTNSVFYFGEEVDFYENGKVVSHEGSWLAGVNRARAGLIMPGLPLMGSRYYQEVAPGVALDRAVIIDLDEDVRTPLRSFTRVLATEETTPLEPALKEYKYYAPGIGLIRDGPIALTRVVDPGQGGR